MIERNRLGGGYESVTNTGTGVALTLNEQHLCHCDGSARDLRACASTTEGLERDGHGEIVGARRACAAGCQALMARYTQKNPPRDGGPWMGY